jgi:predicted metal-dependent hydrolase
MLNKIIEDKELGELVITPNKRSKRVIFRVKDDGIYVTVPPFLKEKELLDVIERMREKLLHKKNQLQPVHRIDQDYTLESDFFKLHLSKGSDTRFMARSPQGELEIIYPPETDFADESLQQWLRKVIIESLRKNAKVILPERLQNLSERYELPYKEVRIGTARGRWGSCSAQKTIILSCLLLLLPQHLVDYVLLHELTHTLEMNHGTNFWLILNRLTDGKALQLREEVKAFHLPF